MKPKTVFVLLILMFIGCEKETILEEFIRLEPEYLYDCYWDGVVRNGSVSIIARLKFERDGSLKFTEYKFDGSELWGTKICRYNTWEINNIVHGEIRNEFYLHLRNGNYCCDDIYSKFIEIDENFFKASPYGSHHLTTFRKNIL